jgi:hypothetical protein
MFSAPFQKNESSFILILARAVVKGRGFRHRRKSAAKSPATAALFTAISEVLYQMSGVLNGYSRSFYRCFYYFWPFERRFERLQPFILPLIFCLGLRILQKSGYAVTISVFLI